jgi:hypothetical protein
MTTSPLSDGGPSLTSDVARRRLQHRARRIEQVLSVLRERRSHAGGAGERPVALDRAIAGVGGEVASVRSRLRKMS